MNSNLHIEDRIVEVHRRLNAFLRELLELVAEFDRREAYKVDAARSMSDWLGYRLGVSDHAAREWARSGAALEGLPAIADALESGDVSWDKVRWLTEFCTPDEDALWANEAAAVSAAEVRRHALQRKRLAREACDRRFKRRYLKIVPDVEEGVVRLWGRLSDIEGMVVKKAIDRIADDAPQDPETGKLVPHAQRCADALVALASQSLGANADHDRATVVCHVDLVALSSDAGVAIIEGDMPIGAETVRRLLCDGRLQAMVHGGDGRPVGAGRTTRVVPHYLRRALMRRDGGCAWDGCTATHWLHAHHIVHVVHGGRTDEDNLLMLCPFHHRCVHEGGWKIRGRPGRDVQIVRPDGRVLGEAREMVNAMAVRGP